MRINSHINANRCLLIEVEDSGLGMSKLQLSKLFQPFTKIMQNRGNNKEGVGLGLAVSRNIGRALGGDITVESVEGKGSRFTLSLPGDCIAHQDSSIVSHSDISIIQDDPSLDSSRTVFFLYRDWIS